MTDSPFLGVPSPAGSLSPFFVGPSGVASNNVTTYPPSLDKLARYATDLAQATQHLKDLVDDTVPYVGRNLAGAVAAIRAMVGLADAMDETTAFRPQLDRSIAAKCHAFKDKAHALLKAALDKAGPEGMNPAKVIPPLEQRVKDATQKVVDLLRAPEHVQCVRDFANDTSMDVGVRFPEVWYLAVLQSFCAELLARTDRADQVVRMAQEVFEQRDESQSVPAITIKEFKTLWDAFVQATAVATGTVGNLPAPDSLSMCLLKVYGGLRLPKAATRQASASSLEADVFSYIVDALKLTDAQKQTLRGKLDELKDAQRDVIRAAKAEAETAQRLPGHAARIGRKTRQRVRAEEACKEKAEAASEFFKDTYGPENEKLYAEFQRGPLMDSFVTVLAIVQFCAAFQELSDPDVSGVQKAADVLTSGLLSLGAVVSTVGRMFPQIDVGIAKLNLAALGKFAESVTTKVAAFAGIMAVVSGAWQVYLGYIEHDPEKMVLGAMTTVSGLAIVVGAYLTGALGAAAAGAAVTGVGVALGLLIAAYLGVKWLLDALKSATEKAIESILESLEKKEIYDGKAAVEWLGLQGPLKDARDALSGWSPYLLMPNPNGAPTREDLTKRMHGLGFKGEDAEAMVEKPGDDVPPLLLAPMAM